MDRMIKSTMFNGDSVIVRSPFFGGRVSWVFC